MSEQPNTITTTWRKVEPRDNYLWERVEDGAKVMLVGTTAEHQTWAPITASGAPLYGPRGGVRHFRSRDKAMEALDFRYAEQQFKASA